MIIWLLPNIVLDVTKQKEKYHRDLNSNLKFLFRIIIGRYTYIVSIFKLTHTFF